MKNYPNASGLRLARLFTLRSVRCGFQFCLLTALIFGIGQVAKAITVSTTADSGAGSLRQAILDANATAGADTITFSVAGTITPLTSLPQITETVTINGYSAPGAIQNTGAISEGFNGTLTVELSGASAGISGVGLRISASNCIIQGLAINRFNDSGIRIDDGAGARIFGNFIGTNLAGTASLGNFNRGILIVSSTGNFIGFTSTMSRNVISGNSGTGISITGGGSATVRRNLIGTNAAGTADLGNTQEGIRIVDSSGSTIGGSDRNIISGNDGSGVSIIQSSNLTAASGNTVSANYIGTTITGNAALANSGSGILINAGGNTVGGLTTATRNVIAGNSANGVSISSSFSNGNTVAGNNIGVGANGTTALGNRDDGIQISSLAAGNTIGGSGVTPGSCNNACNLIGNNGDATSTTARAGIYIDATAGTGNAIRANSVFLNGELGMTNGLGIDLGTPATTANDAGDPDTGANNLQNFPVLSAASNNGLIVGTLNSTAATSFAIDFFLSTTTDGMMSEGRTYLGTTVCPSSLCTMSGNNYSFTFNSTVVLPQTQFVTATATATGTAFAPQAVGDTSEFAAPRIILAQTAAAAPISGRVTNFKGLGLFGVKINLVDATSGETYSTTTNVRGNYSFPNVVVGNGYIITPSRKGLIFNPVNQLVSHLGEDSNINFTAANGKTDAAAENPESAVPKLKSGKTQP